VADKLIGMCKTDRESYEKYWDDISPFIKYGCIKESKFDEKIRDYVLYKDIDGKYLMLKDLIREEEKPAEGETAEAAKTEETVEEVRADETVEAADTEADAEAEEKEPEKQTIYYVTDEVQQSQYINMFRESGLNAVVLRHNIDSAFISHVEQHNEKVAFQRIDADVTASAKDEVDEEALKETTETLTEVFRKALGKENLEIKVEKLKNENISSMITLSEESRRMQDMMKMYGMDPGMYGGSETLVLNAGNKLVQYIAEHKDSDKVPMICEQLYDLAMIAHKPLAPEEMTKFIARSNEILTLLAE
jgi:molecular chaperone HtpG